MPITIDQVTADVAPAAERGGQPPSRSEAAHPAEADERRQREQLERMRQRLARVVAD